MGYLFRLAMHHVGSFLFGKESIYNPRPLTEKEYDEQWEACKLTSDDLARAKADLDAINKIL